MFTLFLDTHGGLITVALYNEEHIYLKVQESEYSHAKFLVPMIKELMDTNHVTFDNIQDIVAVNGPGSFTGLRIGLSVAKTMAYSLNVPIYLISSLSAYLVSDSESDAVFYIEDNKGYYVGEKKNNEFLEERYLEDIDNYKDKYVAQEKLDISKIINYAKENGKTDVHLVRANYVKKIEAEK